MRELLSSPQRRIFFFLSLFFMTVILGSCMAPATESKSVSSNPVSRPEPTPTVRVMCQTSQLLLIVGRGGAALGHQSTPFTFENHSQQTCTLAGYPTLKQLDAGRKPMTEPIQQSSVAYTYRTRGPQLITLAPRGKAYFVIEWYDVCASSFAFFLLITPPDNKTAFLVDLEHNTASSETFSVPNTLPGNQATSSGAMYASTCLDTVNVSSLVSAENLLYQ